MRDPNAPGFAVPELTPAAGPARVPPLGDPPRLAPRRRRAAPASWTPFSRRRSTCSPRRRLSGRSGSTWNRTGHADAYGRNIYGQSVLLARRLIEAGTRVACISWAPDANATWDTHGKNFESLKRTLLPQLDAAVASLLDDLVARGLLERTLVVVMGEFGRSPKVNAAAGRDHWNFCYGLMLAGGGVKGGHVYGASDKIGGRPSSNPVTPADVVATIYQCLGVEKDLELRDNQDRPFQLVPWGDVIRDVLL